MRVSSKKTNKAVTFGIKGRSASSQIGNQEESQFLTIGPALPILPGAPIPPKFSNRSYNSFGTAESPFNVEDAAIEGRNAITLQWAGEGRTIVATRTATEREKNPDRICLDRRGLTAFPSIVDEPKLRLLSLQHNLLTKIDGCNLSRLTKLVFLDLYDNQIERVCNLDTLENLRVLLIGKNRIKKIEGLRQLGKLEVLDLHGNQIVQVSGLDTLVSLKVLNLAGNNIKTIGHQDFQGLIALRELNLRRNKIKKLLGFGDLPLLQKLYLSNNDIQKIEDMGSIAKALQLREITIDGNPVTLNSDYISFLASYLPSLQLLSNMQINEQTRRTAMAWRTNKEQCNAAFLDLSTQICMNVRREEVISNAKINWELLRCRNRSAADNRNTWNTGRAGTSAVQLQKSNKYSTLKSKALEKTKSKGFGSLTSINENVEAKRIHITKRSSSSDNFFRLKDATKVYPLEFKLPPILGSIVDSLLKTKLEEGLCKDRRIISRKTKSCSDVESDSNSDSDISEIHENLRSGLNSHLLNSNNQILDSDKHIYSRRLSLTRRVLSVSDLSDPKILTSPSTLQNEDDGPAKNLPIPKVPCNQDSQSDCPSKSTNSSSGYGSLSSKASSLDSCKSVFSDSSVSSITKIDGPKSKDTDKDKSRGKSAQVKKTVCYKSNRAATARAKYRALTPPSTPPVQNPPKEREQGGDYLIEIVGRCLNVYGQGALRFVDRSWDTSKAQDVNTVKFNYVQFNDVARVLGKLKSRFPNVEHYTLKETNISYFGQLNALAEVQGLTSICIETGNPIVSKDWKTYAVFRLAHWGLKIINGKEITDQEIDRANQEYAGLVDIVMWSLPESLLQPLLQRLRLEKVQKQSGEQITAKEFLFKSDPALRSVVAKEALQWRKGSVTQEDLIWRHKGKQHLLSLINLAVDAIQKLQLLDKEWPSILQEIVHSTLDDYSEMDQYMKQCSKRIDSEK